MYRPSSLEVGLWLLCNVSRLVSGQVRRNTTIRFPSEFQCFSTAWLWFIADITAFIVVWRTKLQRCLWLYIFLASGSALLFPRPHHYLSQWLGIHYKQNSQPDSARMVRHSLTSDLVNKNACYCKYCSLPVSLHICSTTYRTFLFEIRLFDGQKN